ncbi:hypothetical protein K439DRAFT_533403 [Ramaria rubella]|nr:hypothetical protein K439DRAFT_533403 [Ramaria rubella]
MSSKLSVQAAMAKGAKASKNYNDATGTKASKTHNGAMGAFNCATTGRETPSLPDDTSDYDINSDVDSVSSSGPQELPDNAPLVDPDANFPDDDYIAPSIVALQSIIHRLIFNFAHHLEVHHCDLLVALGLGNIRGIRANSKWNIFQRMKKMDINQLCADINLTLSKSDRMCEHSE